MDSQAQVTAANMGVATMMMTDTATATATQTSAIGGVTSARPCSLLGTTCSASEPRQDQAAMDDDEEQTEASDRRVTTAWWTVGGVLAVSWFAVASGKADALIYMVQCALAG